MFCNWMLKSEAECDVCNISNWCVPHGNPFKVNRHGYKLLVG